MTPHEMTLAALAEVAPRAHVAVAAAGPNRAGNPRVGSCGFMADDDLRAVCRAVHLAHTRAGSDGWGWDDPDHLAERVKAAWPPASDQPPAVRDATERAALAYALAAIDPGVPS